MGLQDFIDRIKNWGIAMGIPVIVAILYQFHIQRLELKEDEITLLKDKVELVREKGGIKSCDNALVIIESSKKLHKIEVEQVKNQLNKFVKEKEKLESQIEHTKAQVQVLEIKNKGANASLEREKKINEAKENIIDKQKSLINLTRDNASLYENNALLYKENTVSLRKNIKLIKMKSSAKDMSALTIIDLYKVNAKEKQCSPLLSKYQRNILNEAFKKTGLSKGDRLYHFISGLVSSE